MNDQNECSNPFSPESWELFAVFRGSFLSVQLSNDDAAAFRRIGRLAYLLTLSGDPPASESQGSKIRIDLREAARDLRWLQGFLQDVGRQHEQSELDASEVRLSRRAAEVAVGIGAFALEFEQESDGKA
ncbi:MAG: hypothetical protein K0U98_11570 [Deltaproteobacteria bacterium]|nr:hypothetical protein [Deltaproteobacteria bacterium]